MTVQKAIFHLTLIALLGGLAASPVLGQTTIRGRVTDAATGESLPQANLQIEGTYTGTITNAQGRYSLAVDSLPATVLVRYIGYQTARIRVTDESSARQDVALKPSPMEMDEVVVTGSENPGRRIMERVIEQKKTWWDSLGTYTVDAFSRYTVSNDTGIVAIYETQTEAFWDRERGTREVVRSRRQTENLGNTVDALPAASSVLNLYRDNVTVAGAELMGVTHPDALDRYSFTLDSTRARNGRRVYDILVEPQSRLTSAFRGQVSILDSADAMIEARLRPAQSLRLPRMVESQSLRFEQQFSNFGGPYWLPVDFRAQRKFKLSFSAFLSLPEFNFDQVSRLSGYQLNGPLPDSLYDEESESVVEGTRVAEAPPAQTDSMTLDSLGTDGPFVPLSNEERRVYTNRDSTQQLGEAFRPSGPLADLAEMSSSGGGFSLGLGSDDGAADTTEADTSGAPNSVDVQWPVPRFRYNRVEGPFVGGRVAFEVGERVTLGLQGGHSFFLDSSLRWSYGGSAEVTLPTKALDHLSVSYRYGVDPRYDAEVRLFSTFAQGVNSLWTLLGEPDYYDYFGNERVHVGLHGAIPRADLHGQLQFRNERHLSVTEVSDYNVLGRSSFFGRSTRQPPNPVIEDGQLRSLAMSVRWGDDSLLLGVLPVDRVQLNVEHTGDWLASDFSFTRAKLSADARLSTFFRRRIQPTTLDLRVVGGGALGTLPLQRYGVIEASPLPYTPFGALRTLDDRPYQGSEYAALFWEHNFRTVPFELLGLYGIADRSIELILHGGHGRTWIDDGQDATLRRRGVGLRTADEVHHELGISVNGVLRDLLRIDFTARLDRPAYSIGVSLLRYF